jgi:hypothetical protein
MSTAMLMYEWWREHVTRTVRPSETGTGPRPFNIHEWAAAQGLGDDDSEPSK